MTDGDHAVRSYRPIRPGDVMSLLSTDPYLDQAEVVIRTVVDSGPIFLLSGDWRGQLLEVAVRRIGDTQPLQLTEK